MPALPGRWRWVLAVVFCVLVAVIQSAIVFRCDPLHNWNVLGLTLHASGHSNEAIAELLGLILEPSGTDSGLKQYRKALSWYAEQLRRPART